MKKKLIAAAACAGLALIVAVPVTRGLIRMRPAADSGAGSQPAAAAVADVTQREAAAGVAKPAAALTVRQVDAAGLKDLLTSGGGGTARPLLVNFWATWCGPCREEFPDLVKVDEQYRSRGLDFITVSLDDTADISKAVPDFLNEVHARMPAFLLNAVEPETAINAVDPSWSGGLPATFLFDRNRAIVYKTFGRVNPAELKAAIDRQLGAGQ